MARKKNDGDIEIKRMELTNDNHLDVLGTANEKVAEQVGKGHDVQGSAPPTQQRHRGDGDETTQDCTQGVHTPYGEREPCIAEFLKGRLKPASSGVKGGMWTAPRVCTLPAEGKTCIAEFIDSIRERVNASSKWG